MAPGRPRPRSSRTPPRSGRTEAPRSVDPLAVHLLAAGVDDDPGGGAGRAWHDLQLQIVRLGEEVVLGVGAELELALTGHLGDQVIPPARQGQAETLKGVSAGVAVEELRVEIPLRAHRALELGR